MKIRNLQAFIQDRCAKKSERPSLDYLFKEDRNNEPFLYEILGSDGDVDTMVQNCASFAKDSEQQVFYEFVQNAFDANSKNLFFMMGQVEGSDYLLVVNDGEPFHTDRHTGNKSDKRDGQLFSFLNKGKSDKPNPLSIGKFGMGSKLMYSLLVDQSEEFSTSSLMKDALIDQRKAPYLISWSKGEQIDNFLLDRGGWDRSCGYDNEELLICKILCCYYPLEPGVSQVLFPDHEVSRLTKVINELVRPERLKIRLQKSGSILVLPLGEGKLDLLASNDHLDKIGKRLAPFATIITGYKEFSGKHLDRIWLNDREIIPITADTVQVEIEKRLGQKTDKYLYQFVFSPELHTEDCVNLYKALPVSDTVFNLNFIIDSLDLPTDDSRQGISEVQVASNNIRQAMTLLLPRLEQMMKEDKPMFDRIYDSLIVSRPNAEPVRTPFKEVIVPFLKSHVRTSDGEYHPLGEVVWLKCSTRIPLEKVGITDKFTITGDILKNYGGLGISIPSISFKDIMEVCDKQMLADWLKTLDAETYKSFHEESLELASEDESLCFLRTNKNNVFSYQEVTDARRHVFFGDDGTMQLFKSWEDVEYVELPMAEVKDSEELLWGKLYNNQDGYDSRQAKDFACSLLASIYKRLPDGRKKEVRSSFRILKNMKGEKDTFENLFQEKPEGSILYENFTLREPWPTSVDKSWFVTPGQTMDFINRNWERIVALDDWDLHSQNFVNDIVQAWSDDKEKKGKHVSLYLNQQGVPQDEPYSSIQGTLSDSVSEREYDALCELFGGNGIVPYKYRTVLTRPPFILGEIKFADLWKDGHDTSVQLSKRQMDAVLKVVKGFWDNYFVTENGQEFFVSRLHSNEKNIVCKKTLSDDERRQLLDAGFHVIPAAYSAERQNLSVTEEPQVMLEVLSKIADPLSLLSLIKEIPLSNVLNYFFLKIGQLHFGTDPVAEDDARWKLMKWVAESQGSYKGKLWSIIDYKGKKLPDKLRPNSVSVENGKQYLVYDILPNLEEDDILVMDLKGHLPDGPWFEETYCQERREAITAEKVYDELKSHALNVRQLEFALDFAINGNGAVSLLRLSSTASLRDALDMIASRGFKGFYKYLYVGGFNPSSQIYASEELLVPSEKIPQEITEWVKSNEDEILKLFENRLHAGHEVIRLREEMLKGSSPAPLDKVKQQDYWILENTKKWLLSMQEQGKISFHLDSASSKGIQILQGLVNEADYGNLPLLRCDFTISGSGEMASQLDYLDSNDVVFLDSNSRRLYKKLCLLLRKNNMVASDVLREKNIYMPLANETLMRKHRLANNPRMTIRQVASLNSSWKEWDDRTYIRWKGLPVSENIRIFVSEDLIANKLSLVENESCLLEIPLAENENYGIIDDAKGKIETVCVRYPNGTDENVYKALEKQVVPNVERFQVPFIALQGLKLEELMAKPEIDPKKAELAQNITLEDLLKMNDGRHRLVEEKETKVNNITGFLGECIFKGYADRKHHRVEWSSQEGEGRYDFLLDDETMVDVKTNVLTLADGKSPFYLHLSQMQFLRADNPPKYYICRLSLTDLGITEEYKELGKEFGIETDPSENDLLKQKCKDMAEKYWNSNSVEQFESNIRLYWIKDTFKDVD